MRERDEIEKEAHRINNDISYFIKTETRILEITNLQLEVLLDIRDLLSESETAFEKAKKTCDVTVQADIITKYLNPTEEKEFRRLYELIRERK